MNLWGRLFGLSNTLDLNSLRPEEIRADQISLERQEDKLDEEINRCQSRIDRIVQETVESGKRSRARSSARKVMQLKERIADKEHSLGVISRSLIALGRLQRLVTHQNSAVRSTVLQKLQGLPQPDLTQLLCGEMARSEMKTKGLDSVIEMLDSPISEASEQYDEEAKQLTEAFEAAIEAGDPTLVTEHVHQQEEELEKLQQRALTS